MIPSLASVFVGPLAHYGDTLTLSFGEPKGVRCSALLEADTIKPMLGCFAERFPEAKQRAVVALWSRWYFSRVLPGYVAAISCLERMLPIVLDETFLITDAGRPDVLVLSDEGQPGSGSDVCKSVNRLLRNHLEPLIAALAQHGRLSKVVLWGEAAGFAEWTAESIVACPHTTDEARLRATQVLTLIDRKHSSDGAENPLYRPRIYDRSRRELRRTCCLNYEMGGDASHCSTCPLLRKRKCAS